MRYRCGRYEKIQEGDVIEVYEIKEVKRKLELNWPSKPYKRVDRVNKQILDILANILIKDFDFSDFGFITRL